MNKSHGEIFRIFDHMDFKKIRIKLFLFFATCPIVVVQFENSIGEVQCATKIEKLEIHVGLEVENMLKKWLVK